MIGLALHAGPMVTANDRLRRRFWPGLAGIGTPATVALTFDDGPDRRSTPRILDELDRLGMPATFFVLGEMHEQDPGLTREVFDRGHEIGIHGWSHRSHLFRSHRSIRRDVQRSVTAHEDVFGEPPRWFRPPYGSLSASTLGVAHRCGVRTVLWSVAGRDWSERATATSVFENVKDGLGPGATVLLHDSDCTSAPASWRSTLGALPLLADLFERRQLSPVTLSQHLDT